MSQPTFAPERREIWYSDGTSGFYALRVARNVWTAAMRQSLQLAVSPRRVAAGRRVRLRFAVSSGGTAIRGALVRIAGRTVRTDRRGRAQAVVRLRRAGVHTARATRQGYDPAAARVRAVRGPGFAG